MNQPRFIPLMVVGCVGGKSIMTCKCNDEQYMERVECFINEYGYPESNWWLSSGLEP